MAAIVGWAVALALTGCSQLVAPGSQAPVIDSHTATSISSPQTDGQVPVGGASLSSRDVSVSPATLCRYILAARTANTPGDREGPQPDRRGWVHFQTGKARVALLG